MQIKKITATTLREAIEKMKSELGEDAIVLSTKSIEGDSEIGSTQMFELTAGIDSESISEPKSAKKQKVSKEISFENELNKLTQKVYGKNQKNQTKIESDDNVKIELSNSVKVDNFENIKKVLLDRDVDQKYINQIIHQLKKYSNFFSQSNIDSFVVSTIASLISTKNFEINKKQKPKIVSLIGPTGVGKTTCISKLAVISKILHNLDVGLITIDTYRLGAMDQLKIFSEISSIDFQVAYEPSDIASILKTFSKKDIVFIDTVGRSPNQSAQLKTIKDFLNPITVSDKFLVLSANTTSSSLVDAAKKFEAIGYDGLIFTKLDECVTYGGLLKTVREIEKPIFYLTNGQVIPDDIMAADDDFIANMIYSGKIIQ